MSKNNIYFFANGNSAVCKDGEQVPDLQIPWIELFFRHLVENGENPLDYLCHLPTGHTATAFKTESGWNWRIT